MSQCWCFYCDHAVLVNDGLEGELLPQLPDRTNDPAGGCGHVEIQMSQCWCFCTDHAVLVNDGLEGEVHNLTSNKEIRFMSGVLAMAVVLLRLVQTCRVQS